MRRLLLVLLLLVLPTIALAQKAAPPDDVAHSSEKETREAVQGGEGHAGGNEETKTFVGIPVWIWKLANMVTFLGLLFYLARGPVAEAFRAKGIAVRAAAEEAKMRRAKADQLASDIQARLTQIEQEVAAIAARAQQDGEKQKSELMIAAENEGRKILTAARNEVDNRLKLAKTELTAYAGELAAERAEGILRDSITEADQRKLFRESVQEIAEVRS